MLIRKKHSQVNSMRSLICSMALMLLTAGCNINRSDQPAKNLPSNDESSLYHGTASVSQGLATTGVAELYNCPSGRITQTGVIYSTDGRKWTVPAKIHFGDDAFPLASDLHNPCNGNTYGTVEEAKRALVETEPILVDVNGSMITAYVFADNYFEMYINGIPVGKDRVPFTPFNSSIIQFKAKRPFTIAIRLVDWEEDLGIGTEKNQNSRFHAGDGGLVAVFKDEQDSIIATTHEYWKAQTFYTAPIKNLNCVSESGSLRRSDQCDDADSDQGTLFYGLHWELPDKWEEKEFDDSLWPNASTFTNAEIGVDNKKSYTNFTDIFDDESNDAKFIWSSNVVLDNDVVVRYSVQ